MKSTLGVGGKWLAALALSAGCLPSPEISVPDFAPPPTLPAPPSPSACAEPYPDASKPLPDGSHVIDSAFTLRDEAGPFTMGSLYEPCTKPARLLVLRLVTPWCGPCLWQAAHTGELLHSDIADRLHVLDVVVRNAQNRTATLSDLAEVRKAYDVAPHLAISDVADRMAAYFGVWSDGDARFPAVAVINQQTMQILGFFSNPDPDRLLGLLRIYLARADGLPEPLLASSPLYDGRFTRDRWELIQQMRLLADWQPPLDPTNKVEQSPAAAALGRSLFFDVGLTSAGSIGCVTCHSPDTAYMDGQPTGHGLTPTGLLALGDRNTPWLGGVAGKRFQFWDGRADSLWSQTLGPFENDKEISSDRMYVVRTSLGRYRAQYEAVFGPAPDLSDRARFPVHARPDMAAWAQMTAADQHLVSGTYANLGKALAAYLRGIRPLPVALDRYAAGESDALTPSEKNGLLYFFEVGCIQCHYGPLLLDGTSHSNYFPTGHPDLSRDWGRLVGLSQLLASEFRGDGPFSDAPQAASWLSELPAQSSDVGQFRTPSLRGVADTAPYTHGGTAKNLDELIALYATAGVPDGDPQATGMRDLALVRFDPYDPRNDLLIQFLRTLKATVSQP